MQKFQENRFLNSLRIINTRQTKSVVIFTGANISIMLCENNNDIVIYSFHAKFDMKNSILYETILFILYFIS